VKNSLQKKKNLDVLQLQFFSREFSPKCKKFLKKRGVCIDSDQFVLEGFLKIFIVCVVLVSAGD